MSATPSSTPAVVVLNGASDRLRDVPGFPRRRGRPRKTHGKPSSSGDGFAGAVAAQTSALSSGAVGSRISAAAVTGLSPRLLTVEQSADYLAIGSDTVYSLVSQGVLKRVRIPDGSGGELRKILLDRQDLDRAIEAWRERP